MIGSTPAVRRVLLIGGLLVAASLGAVLSRLLLPAVGSSVPRPGRPIVQIVRQQPGLPDLSDLVERMCPSVALILPRGSDPSALDTAGAARGFLVSGNGWLLSAGPPLPQTQLEAIFGDGRRAALSEIRTDPITRLSIVKATEATGAPLDFNDQPFPRVGQSGLLLSTPVGQGCSANAAMIGSDFLADGGAAIGYVRLSPRTDPWVAGLPFAAADGRVGGISIMDAAGAVIPAPIAAVIVEELIRGSLSPSTNFGFRAIDYAAPFSARLGDYRSGAGVAFVQREPGDSREGLLAGDIVSAVNEIPVSSASELNRLLDGLSDKATLTVLRRSQQLQVTVARNTPGHARRQPNRPVT